MLLPALDAAYQVSSAASGSTDFALLLAFLLSKRACLYASAGAAVAVSALRSRGAEPRTGARLKSLTAEIFGSEAAATLEAPEGRDTVQVLDSLDESPALAQAVALPLILSLLLLGSFALLPNEDSGAATGAGSMLAEGADVLRAVASGIAPLSNAALCLVFCRAEAAALLSAATSTPDGLEGASLATAEPRPEVAAAATAVAAVATAAAFGLPSAVAWPVQNVVNICIAISVSRLLALGRLLPIMLVLAALAAYDVVFAGGAASATMAQAVDPSAASTAADAQSVMESVARSRLSGTWQPGLIQVRVGGRLTDGLGLGDIVFPSLLAGWAARFDQRAGVAVLPAVLGGYAVGCVLLEVAPRAVSPAALSCLVPATLTAIMLRLAATGATEDAFSWDGAPTQSIGPGKE